jgi:septal ring factor EnvC (AmiA/AmiB activator)
VSGALQLFIGLLSSVVVALLSAGSIELAERRNRRGSSGEPVDPVEGRRQRIERLQRSLRESMTLLSELDRDITAGQERAAELQRQIDHNAELAKLTQEQADAMRDLMSDVVGTNLGRSERRAFWQQFALNLLFFGLGVAATLIIS